MTNLTNEELNTITGGTKIPYLVKKGDTLSKLADRFHCTVEDICEWNKIENPNMISIGQKLIILF